jgi:hypothetical protein
MRKEWYSTADVSDRVGYSVRWVERQIDLGRLRAVAYDGGNKRSFRIRNSDYEAFWRTYFHDAQVCPPASER